MSSGPLPGELVLLAVTVDKDETVLVAAKLQWAIHHTTQEHILVPGTLRSLLEDVRASSMVSAELNELYLTVKTEIPYLPESDRSGTPDSAQEEPPCFKLNLHSEDAWAAYWLACRTNLTFKAPHFADCYQLKRRDSPKAKAGEAKQTPSEISKVEPSSRDQVEKLTAAFEERNELHRLSHNELLARIKDLNTAIKCIEKGLSSGLYFPDPGAQQEPKKGTDTAGVKIDGGKGTKVGEGDVNSGKESDADWVLESATTSPKLTS